MAEQTKVTTLEKVVIRFSGDSGDGMQLTGTIFSNLSAIFGNEISTFPDYPAEVRAPQGTLSGVSGFQVHLGSRKIFTPGDKADVMQWEVQHRLTSLAMWNDTPRIIYMDTPAVRHRAGIPLA